MDHQWQYRAGPSQLRVPRQPSVYVGPMPLLGPSRLRQHAHAAGPHLIVTGAVEEEAGQQQPGLLAMVRLQELHPSGATGSVWASQPPQLIAVAMAEVGVAHVSPGTSKHQVRHATGVILQGTGSAPTSSMTSLPAAKHGPLQAQELQQGLGQGALIAVGHGRPEPLPHRQLDEEPPHSAVPDHQEASVGTMVRVVLMRGVPYDHVRKLRPASLTMPAVNELHEGEGVEAAGGQ
mmetsp:Transcript_48104/g.153518  ORF Transcript_48104/g.153518 Transcript_48104/m.153518 type:complete len:234 (-) Transcript_48104:869-1570(-)